MSVFDKGLVTVLVCAGVFALLAIPLILRKVPRNPVYGYRTRVTLGDDYLWFEANAHFGRAVLLACAVSATAIVVLHRSGVAPALFLNASIAVLVVPLLVAALATRRHLQHLQQRRQSRK